MRSSRRRAAAPSAQHEGWICEATCGICTACPPPPAPPPAPCSSKSGKCSESCTDVEPPAHWDISTCAGQLAGGKCPERWSLNDGYCEATCGICVACDAEPLAPATMAPTAAPTRVLFSSLPPPPPISSMPCSPLCADAAARALGAPRARSRLTPTLTLTLTLTPTLTLTLTLTPTLTLTLTLTRCAEQKANGKCLERASAADGFCELTCAICTQLARP